MGSASRGLPGCRVSSGSVQGRRRGVCCMCGGGVSDDAFAAACFLVDVGEVFCITDSDYCTWKE